MLVSFSKTWDDYLCKPPSEMVKGKYPLGMWNIISVQYIVVIRIEGAKQSQEWDPKAMVCAIGS